MRLVAAALLAWPVLAHAQFPGTAWPTATPESVGLNGAVLDSLDREIAAGRYGNVDRMLVIRGGRAVIDKRYTRDYDRIFGDSSRARNALVIHDPTGSYNYFNPWWHPYYRRGDLHSLQSVTKTITSVVIGAALQRGEFPSIETPVLSFFDTTNVAAIDARKRRMTIRHLLTMTGGFDWDENLPYIDPDNTTIQMEGAYDWVKFTIDKPMAREPGEVYNYNSGETLLLSHIFKRATGVDIEEYAARHLFQPLGITRWFWKRTPAGVVDTEGGLYLEAADLARIWYLFLKGGNWNGQQVVSADWVRASTAPSITAGRGHNPRSYGFKWWLVPDPTDESRTIWAGSGFGGQLPFAFPEHDMIVVFYAWNILPVPPSLPQAHTLERLVHAVTGPVPPARR